MEGAIKWRAVVPLVRGLLRKLATPEAIKDWSLTAPDGAADQDRGEKW
jgi:hypothetical protein